MPSDSQDHRSSLDDIIDRHSSPKAYRYMYGVFPGEQFNHMSHEEDALGYLSGKAIRSLGQSASNMDLLHNKVIDLAKKLRIGGIIEITFDTNREKSVVSELPDQEAKPERFTQPTERRPISVDLKPKKIVDRNLTPD